jgi:hypothetical protein
MSYRIDISAPHHPGLVEEEIPAREIEEAAQVFRAQVEAPEAWPLAETVEVLATKERIEFLKPDGRTVVARLVTAGERV